MTAFSHYCSHAAVASAAPILSPPFQVEGWGDLMQGAADVECCLFLDCPEEEQEKRLLARGVTSGRSDDNLESARKRFKTYLTETIPVVEHFEKQGKLRRVAAEHSPDAVYDQTRKAVLEFLP
jgi:UMP-CMP kinase